MPPFLDLADELLYNILIEARPEDLAALTQTCRALNKYICNNRLLWRNTYLKYFVSFIDQC